MFRKVLVANRGEIAVRVIRALRELGIASVAVYSDVDVTGLHVRVADEAVAIGPSPAAQSYLNIASILDAARLTGADAIHPGYGFLSENANFAQACLDAGFTFIGPPPDSIRRLGEKTAARQLAREAGVPVVPGTVTPMATVDEASAAAKKIGYPVLLKAAAGGGGKGMRLVEDAGELAAAFRDASSESERSFSNAAVYLEKAIKRPRHVEIQVLGDMDGKLIHLGERECSLQRRHQKLIEECPSPLSLGDPGLRDRMGAAAVRVASAAGYANAGTVEFLVDESGAFYFLEMNTRLQVEHPVTELVTGLDLVREQLRLAAGEPLSIDQADVSWNGSAIECRLYAEDPEQGFYPSPGRILQWQPPYGPGVRVDDGVYAGWEVPLDYDPLLAKLIVWSQTRDLAIARMRRALAETVIKGISTNLTFFREIFADAVFQSGHLHTGFVQEFFERRQPNGGPAEDVRHASLLAAVLEQMERDRANLAPAAASNGLSPWTSTARQRGWR